MVLLLFGVLFFATVAYLPVSSPSHQVYASLSNPSQRRPSRDSFDSAEPQIRLNGLLHQRGKGVFIRYTVPKSASIHKPDHGGLNITLMTDGSRKIGTNPERLFGEVYQKSDDEEYWDPYYAFDDDFVRASVFEKGNQCRRTSWHKSYFPTCNSAHETPIITGDNKFLGSGSYRDVFSIHEDQYDIITVLKAQRYHGNPFTIDRYEFIRNDAMVMERLTASPRIVDIYGHCGTSVLTEFFPGEVEEFLIPGPGRREKLNDKNDVDPKNDLTAEEKLYIALQMAESMADLHGFKDGVIVHDDIQLCQYLFVGDGLTIKLNDFNRAEVMLYDEKKGDYCRYQNGHGAGDYRAPEEYRDGHLNEKIDVWSLGNNIYALLTGLWIFYDEADDTYDKIQKRIMDGDIPYIDSRYRTRSFAEKTLVEVMEQAWTLNPDDRIDVFEVVKILRKASARIYRKGNTL